MVQDHDYHFEGDNRRKQYSSDFIRFSTACCIFARSDTRRGSFVQYEQAGLELTLEQRKSAVFAPWRACFPLSYLEVITARQSLDILMSTYNLSRTNDLFSEIDEDNRTFSIDPEKENILKTTAICRLRCLSYTFQAIGHPP